MGGRTNQNEVDGKQKEIKTDDPLESTHSVASSQVA